MTEIEQEMLRRVLIDLFLANPRKRMHQSKQENQEEIQQKTAVNTRGKWKQQPGGKINDH